tara:strand:- start:13627 stop:13872 length:246 start_codon:yes stop_codon:yes gene_type:complete
MKRLMEAIRKYFAPQTVEDVMRNFTATTRRLRSVSVKSARLAGRLEQEAETKLTRRDMLYAEADRAAEVARKLETLLSPEG